MLSKEVKSLLAERLEGKKKDGTYKEERVITGPQRPEIAVAGRPVLNFCSNNYLGLSDHPEVKKAAQKTLESHGFGMSSVRFICGTQDTHKELEKAVSDFLKTEDTILYSSCFDANGGLFESFLAPEDVIISASLNHASIIDGIRLCKARRMRYGHDNMRELEKCLQETRDCGIRVVVTDGVFSMEGEFAPLDKIAALCEQYGALLVVDDSHATGFIGKNGRGTGELSGIHEKIDLFTSTFGKALGGASGGYISGGREFVDWFRNVSRPYLFSNSLAPSLAAGALKAIEIVRGAEGEALRSQLEKNTLSFREEMKERGFHIKDGTHPIVPIMLGDAGTAARMASDLMMEGVYVTGFSYPVVPKGAARIRVQVSAVHTEEHIDRAVSAFQRIGKSHKVIE